MGYSFRDVLGRIHSALFAHMFDLRARSWTPSVAEPCPVGAEITVSGFLNEALGIGRAAVLTVQALRRARYVVHCQDLRPLNAGLLSRQPTAMPFAGQAQIWLIVANPPETKIALFRHDYDTWKTRYRIAYWAWESSQAPANWVETAVWLHEIWVPSQFVSDAFRAAFHAAGQAEQAAKLKVVPYPVPVPDSLPGKTIYRSGGQVTAISLFDPRSHFERKNPLGAIKAWVKAFPLPSKKARLIIKGLAGSETYPAYAELVAAGQGRADIELRMQTLSDQETLSLIGACDILVSLHRGEGFGLTLAEAMSSGLSVLATNWSGNLDFMNHENAWPVAFSLRPAAEVYNGPEAQWSEPDIDAAAAGLRQLVEDQGLRKRLGAQARLDIACLNSIWDDIFPRFNALTLGN